MKTGVAITGLVLLFIAAFFFYVVFVGGTFLGFVITGSSTTANFIAFLFVIAALPIGSGLAFFGLSFKSPILAAGSQVVYKSSRVGSAALAVGVIAIIVAFASVGVMYSAVNSQSSELSTVSGQVNSLNTEVSNYLANVNSQPRTIAYKVDWCNKDNTGQDRFCPQTIVVNQGDTVQVLFIHNDTDAHTFTLDTAPYYSLQINASSAGMHNFLTNSFNTGNCSNSGSYAQEKTGLSNIYCVSGSSLLPPGGGLVVPQNPTPAVTLNGSAPIVGLPVDNMVHFDNTSAAAINSTVTEIWGIASFQASYPGVYEFFCHYHVANGMFGYLVVLPNGYCSQNPKTCGLNATSTA
jgi:plastocyanin